MKITILNWRDTRHPLAGGAEISLFEQAKYWQKRGAEITWYSSHFPNGQKEETNEGIRVIRTGSHYTTHLCTFFLYKKNICASDLVIDSFHFVPFFTPFYVKKPKIIALINEPAKHVWFKNLYPPFSLIGFLLEQFFFLFYRDIPFITAAESIASELISYGIQRKNISIIPHGVSSILPKEKKKDKIPTIIYLAQIAQDKGIEDAIEAVKILLKKQNIFFWIVGKCDNENYMTKIKQLLNISNMGKNTTIFGFVSEKEKFDLLSRAFVLIHPSIREGWGLNVIEANSVGTPAVGYNVSGLKDSIQHMETGLLINHMSPLGLVDGIEKLITDRDLYKKLSGNAVIWAKNFTWEKTGRESWELLKKVYERKKNNN